MDTDLSMPELCGGCREWREKCRCPKTETSASNGAPQQEKIALKRVDRCAAENYARTAETIFDDPRLTREGKLTGVTMLFNEAILLEAIDEIERLQQLLETKTPNVRISDGAQTK